MFTLLNDECFFWRLVSSIVVVDVRYSIEEALDIIPIEIGVAARSTVDVTLLSEHLIVVVTIIRVLLANGVRWLRVNV